MSLPQIDVNKLSCESKEFIDRFRKIDQKRYDQLSQKVETSKTPVTANQADYIMR